MSPRDDRAHWTARYASEIRESAPSAWVAEHAAAVPADAVCLDLACGAGRHAALLAAPARTVVALDFVELVVRRASGAAGVAGVVAEAGALPFRAAAFDLVVVVNFLDRSVFPALASLLRPGGRLIVETFTTENLQRVPAERRRGPSNPAFLLRPGELPRLVEPLRVVASYEGQVRDAAGERWSAGVVAERGGGHPRGASGRADLHQPVQRPETGARGTGVAPGTTRPAVGRSDAVSNRQTAGGYHVRERSNDEQARDPAAIEGATAEEREGMDLLGRESVRDGAIEGVSGVGGIPGLRREAYRTNPPQMDDVNNMAGDLSQSGGVAGGTEEGMPGGGTDEAR